ncbi:MAG: 6-bladed beta-propeller [Phycisphaerales bacterium]|nr:MAG: 6-bladed beta-propeller [Phycisphaerales bacterium]
MLPRLAIRLVLLPVVLGLVAGCEPPAITPNGVIGIFGGVGLGPGAFSYPRAITAEPDGSVFVVDKSGRVQRFGADGTLETYWRMPETAQGKPVGLTVHPDGRIFVADTHYHRVMVFDRDGNQLGSFGRKGTGDGEFLLPTDVAVDADGFIYVSEYQGNDRISKWSSDLKFVKAIGKGLIDGKPLRRPAGIDIDDQQTLWIADACNHRIVRLSRSGEVLAAFGGFGDGPGELRYPYDISVSPSGEIMVCEYEGNRLQWFARDGRSLRIWGGAGRKPGELFAPWGAAFGPGGNVYVVDSLNSRVQIVRP